MANQLVASEPGFELVAGDVIRPSLMGIGLTPNDTRWKDYLDTYIRLWNTSGQNETASETWLNTGVPEFIK